MKFYYEFYFDNYKNAYESSQYINASLPMFSDLTGNYFIRYECDPQKIRKFDILKKLDRFGVLVESQKRSL